MRVVLIDPPNHCLSAPGSSVQTQPLGLGYVAAALAAEHEVVQIIPDARIWAPEVDIYDAIVRAVVELRPGLVGLTAVTATWPSARTLARRLRAACGVPIVLGGVHAAFQPEQCLAEPAIDLVVRGEGELAAVLLARAIEGGGEVRGVPGVWGRDGVGVWRGPPLAPADPDSLAPPRREGILWDEHLQPAFYQSMITLRGCPYTCIYCSVPASSERKTRYRSGERVVDEVAELRARWRIPYLFFHDSVFTLNRKRALAILDRLIERDLRVPFCCQTRTDRVDPELLLRMKEAGCHQIFFGIESGHVESLRRMNKAMPLAEIREAVGWVKDLGIRCAGFFMVGFPWETAEHLDATADFATSLGLDAVSLFSATPLPGTALWEMEGGVDLPESIDFRRPQINMTQMPDAEYAGRFVAIRERVDAYNRSVMLGAMARWPRG